MQSISSWTPGLSADPPDIQLQGVLAARPRDSLDAEGAVPGTTVRTVEFPIAAGHRGGRGGARHAGPLPFIREGLTDLIQELGLAELGGKMQDDVPPVGRPLG